MKEGRIWLYVSPTVGIPLFFLAFITAVLLVHASILINTSWFGGYWEGGPRSEPVATAAAPAPAPAPMADAMAPAEAPAQ